MIKGNKGRLVLATLCMIVVAATQALAAYLIEPALDDIFVTKIRSCSNGYPLPSWWFFF